MNQERIIAEVGTGSRFWRGFARKGVGSLFRSEVQESAGGLARAEQLLVDGYGLIICANHFSRGDPVRIFDEIIFKSNVMRKRRIAVAVASHQFDNILKFSGKLLDLQLLPVVTNETIRLNKASQDDYHRIKSLFSYLKKSAETLKQAGIVLLFPQGTRQTQLVIPEKGAAGVLARFLNEKLERLAFLCIGLGIDGVEDYSREKIGGLNLARKYQMVIGQTWTWQEILQQVGTVREVDRLIFTQLGDLVPANYKRSSQN